MFTRSCGKCIPQPWKLIYDNFKQNLWLFFLTFHFSLKLELVMSDRAPLILYLLLVISVRSSITTVSLSVDLLLSLNSYSGAGVFEMSY